jgi:hypothetical protein
METHRKSALIVGVLFLLATAAGVASLSFIDVLDEAEYLSLVAEQEVEVLFGVLLIFIMSFSCAAIAIWLYPVLRPHAPGAALGSVAFRIIEAVFHTLNAVLILAVLSLSREYAAAGAPAGDWFAGIGGLLLRTRDWAGDVAGTLSWCLGGLLYYWVFFRARLIPRWLAGWGILGVPLTVTGVLLVFFGLTDSFSTLHVILNIPLGLQELVLAVWLIARGFHPSAVAAPAGNSEK